jgi:hypothetical protein
MFEFDTGIGGCEVQLALGKPYRKPPDGAFPTKAFRSSHPTFSTFEHDRQIGMTGFGESRRFPDQTRNGRCGADSRRYSAPRVATLRFRAAFLRCGPTEAASGSGGDDPEPSFDPCLKRLGLSAFSSPSGGMTSAYFGSENGRALRIKVAFASRSSGERGFPPIS